MAEPLAQPDATRLAPTAEPFAPSLQSVWTGLAGLVVLIVATFASHETTAEAAEPNLRLQILIVAATFAAMAMVELLVQKVHRRNFDFATPRKDPLLRGDLGTKYLGLVGTLALAWIAYVVLSEYAIEWGGETLLDYSESWYRGYFDLLKWATVALLGVAPLYYWLCERYGTWARSEDELLAVGAYYAQLWESVVLPLARLRWRQAKVPGPTAHVWAALRSFLVKFFFLPLMVVFVISETRWIHHDLSRLELADAAFTTPYLTVVYDFAFRAIFYVDVVFATIGYLCTLRLFDAHVRSAEPTLFGWMVALACYPPLNQATDFYFFHGEDNGFVADVHAPIWFAIIAMLVLLLVLVYVIATLMFGLRFSNLTHRGIISKGPYAVVRHPAYASKALARWLISMPFLTSWQAAVRMVGWNLVYIARALTEERHLSRYRDYREYKEKVRWKFIPRVW